MQVFEKLAKDEQDSARWLKEGILTVWKAHESAGQCQEYFHLLKICDFDPIQR